jgi:predicted Zn-dependent protease
VVIAQEYRRGLALMAQQKPAEAIEAFDQVLERDPGHANAKLKRAQALSQVGGLIRLLENSIRRLDAQLAQNPGNAQLKAQRDKAVADRERLLTVK